MAGKDYEKNIVYKDIAGRELLKADNPQVGGRIFVTVKGCGAYTGEKTVDYRILKKSTNIAKAKIKILKKFYYTGKEIVPNAADFNVKLGKDTLEFGRDYEILPYPNNPKKGKLKFLVIGKDDFGGTKTITITVRSQIMQWKTP